MTLHNQLKLMEKFFVFYEYPGILTTTEFLKHSFINIKLFFMWAEFYNQSIKYMNQNPNLWWVVDKFSDSLIYFFRHQSMHLNLIPLSDLRMYYPGKRSLDTMY